MTDSGLGVAALTAAFAAFVAAAFIAAAVAGIGIRMMTNGAFCILAIVSICMRMRTFGRPASIAFAGMRCVIIRGPGAPTVFGGRNIFGLGCSAGRAGISSGTGFRTGRCFRYTAFAPTVPGGRNCFCSDSRSAFVALDNFFTGGFTGGLFGDSLRSSAIMFAFRFGCRSLFVTAL